MATRITQEFVEALTSSDPVVRITQDFVEVLVISRVLTPDPASLSLSIIEPTVVAGSGISVAPDPASVSFATVSPGVIHGSLAITPATRNVQFVTITGLVIAGNLNVSPFPSSLKLAVNGPILDVYIQPATVSVKLLTTRTEEVIAISNVALDTVNPTIVLSSHSFTPTPAAVVFRASGPTVIESGGVRPYALAFMVA